MFTSLGKRQQKGKNVSYTESDIDRGSLVSYETGYYLALEAIELGYRPSHLVEIAKVLGERTEIGLGFSDSLRATGVWS